MLPYITHAEEGDDSSTSTSTDSALKVTSVTFYPQGNGKHHRTSKFQLVERGTPILRRGQTFFIAIAFGQDQNKRQYDSNRDEIWLRLSFGPQSSPMNGTQQVIKVDKLLHTDENRWAARIKGHDKNAVTIEVTIIYPPIHPSTYYHSNYNLHTLKLPILLTTFKDIRVVSLCLWPPCVCTLFLFRD